MKSAIKKWIAATMATVLLLSCIPTFSATAASDYPNTHVNTGNMAADIVAVAETQYGYCEGSLSGNPSYASTNNYQKYGLWYDNNVDYIGVQRAAWCAAFVSWCANQAGIPSSIVYYHAYCPYGVNWFKNRGRFQYSQYHGGSYTPKAGDIIYFGTKSESTHIGIVRYADDTNVYTVEGNTSGAYGEVNEGGGVFKKYYPLGHSRILGYGIPAYEDNSGHKITFETNGGTAVTSVNVKDGTTLNAPTSPTRYGFDFVGWYCNPELTDPYDFSATVSYGFTLYAKWAEAYWGANTDLMPVDGQLQTPYYEDTQQNIWPYYNDDGSVTLYSGVEQEWAWPRAYMTYANSFDSANDAYIYVKKDGTAKFNAMVTYLDGDGIAHDVTLSQLAGRGDEDFEAGYAEFFVNLGQYVASQGHLTESGNIKYTKIAYYVIGALDSYVKIYDMRLTSEFALESPVINLYSKDVTAQGGAAGSYVYNGGTLTLNATSDAGYSVTFSPNATFDPTSFGHLLMDLQSNVPFNVSLELTRADGDATLQFRNEFFDAFGLDRAPDSLPAGTWQSDLNLNGYFYYNGGLIDNTTVKTVTISLDGKGTLVLTALQAAHSFNTYYITNEDRTSGSYTKPQDMNLESDVYTIDSASVSNVPGNLSVSEFIANFKDTSGNIAVKDSKGNSAQPTDTVGTGMTVTLSDEYQVILALSIAVNGDIDGDGSANSVDVRLIMANTTQLSDTFSLLQTRAGDLNNDAIVSTADARIILLKIATA